MSIFYIMYIIDLTGETVEIVPLSALTTEAPLK